MEGIKKPIEVEKFREYALKMVDFIADYYDNIENFPVLSQVKPAYLRELLPASAPMKPESFEDVLTDVKEKIIPGVTHWQSPNFFAYFPSSSSTAGFLGDMLSSTFNIIGFSWLASPAATELEIIVLDWLANLLKLPPQFLSSGEGGGLIQGSASEAVLIVLVAARDKVLRRIGKEHIHKLVVYGSDQVHSFLQKACLVVGILPENYRALDTNPSDNYSLDCELVQHAISTDLANGMIPLFLCGTVGTTSSAAADPLLELGKLCQKHGIWFHIDAAYAGGACICPEFRHYINGVEYANSFNLNANKWFFTNFDSSLLWVKEREALIQCFSTNPEYLKTKVSEENTVVDFKDWEIPLGRRFRSLKLWFLFKLYGVDNLRMFIRNHIKFAKLFEEFVRSDSRFEVVTKPLFSLVCFRLLPTKAQDDGDELNYKLLDAINASGKIFITHTALSGKLVLRFAIGAPFTEEKHIMEAWKVIQEHATLILMSKWVHIYPLEDENISSNRCFSENGILVNDG